MSQVKQNFGQNLIAYSRRFYWPPVTREFLRRDPRHCPPRLTKAGHLRLNSSRPLPQEAVSTRLMQAVNAAITIELKNWRSTRFPDHAERCRRGKDCCLLSDLGGTGCPPCSRGWLDVFWTPRSDVSHSDGSRPNRAVDDAHHLLGVHHHLRRNRGWLVLSRRPSRSARFSAACGRLCGKEVAVACSCAH